MITINQKSLISFIVLEIGRQILHLKPRKV